MGIYRPANLTRRLERIACTATFQLDGESRIRSFERRYGLVGIRAKLDTEWSCEDECLFWSILMQQWAMAVKPGPEFDKVSASMHDIKDDIGQMVSEEFPDWSVVSYFSFDVYVPYPKPNAGDVGVEERKENKTNG